MGLKSLPRKIPVTGIALYMLGPGFIITGVREGIDAFLSSRSLGFLAVVTRKAY